MFSEFLVPSSIPEAVKLRTSIASSMYLAGGTEVNSIVWPCRPTVSASTAISLSKLPLGGITIDADRITIGANVTIQELVESDRIPSMLSKAVRLFANRNVRSMGTLGGNIGGNRACTNIAPTLLALSARISLVSEKGEESIAIDDYIAKHDALKLITAIEIPAGWRKRKSAVRKYSRTANDVSIVSCGVSFELDGGAIKRPLVAVNGATPRATRLTELEKQLDGKPLPPREQIDALVKTLVSPASDLRGSAEFKKHICAVLVSDALHEAAGSTEAVR